MDKGMGVPATSSKAKDEEYLRRKQTTDSLLVPLELQSYTVPTRHPLRARVLSLSLSLSHAPLN